MKKISYIILSILIVFSYTSCDDILDAFPKDKMTDDNFWKTELDAEKMLVDLYASAFPTSDIFWTESMSDNAYLAWDWWGGQQQVGNSSYTVYGQVPQAVWTERYASIRKCWYLLENIDKIPFSDNSTRERIVAEVRFIIAYNYHILISYFGDVPLVKKTMLLEESKALKRTPRQEIVAYIISELDQAANVLQSNNMEWGHITWGATQVLKARIYLYENDYASVLPVTEGLKGKYSLYSAGETPYEDLFSGASERNDEIILSVIREKRAGSLTAGHSGNGAMLLKGMSGGGPYTAIYPSGSLIDSYPMADGRLIKENGSKYNPKDPYTDRDPRFYQSVVYPTGQIKCLNATTNTVEPRLFDPENPTTIPEQQYNAAEPTRTGYMWNKYVDYSVYAMNEVWDCTNDIIIFRYADVLLMEAEALAEIQGSGAKIQICDLIDQLRDRVKGGRVNRENYNSREDLIELVRNERRIELANEGLRFTDIRRWKIAEKNNITEGVGMFGEYYGAYMRLDGIGKDDRTIMVDGVPRRYIEIRHFDPAKHYLFPIPQNERELNLLLTQNPGW